MERWPGSCQCAYMCRKGFLDKRFVQILLEQFGLKNDRGRPKNDTVRVILKERFVSIRGPKMEIVWRVEQPGENDIRNDTRTIPKTYTEVRKMMWCPFLVSRCWPLELAWRCCRIVSPLTEEGEPIDTLTEEGEHSQTKPN